MSFQNYVLCKYQITVWPFCKVYFPLCAEEVCHFKLMFSANLASQFGHLFSCAEETCHFNLTY
jgi:hypothetical protein